MYLPWLRSFHVLYYGRDKYGYHGHHQNERCYVFTFSALCIWVLLHYIPVVTLRLEALSNYGMEAVLADPIPGWYFLPRV